MSKKKIIAIVTVIVLLLAAGISVGVFLYGRGETQATDGSQTSTTDQNQVSDGNSTTDGNTTNPNEGDIVDADEAGDNETVDNENENADNQTANNNNAVDNNNTGNAGVTTDTNVNNVGETTITRIEEQDRLVSEHFLDWWKPMLVRVNQKTALGVNLPQLTVEKTAITGVGGDEFVYAGQDITYVITVTNNSDETIENIEITDKIPQNTSFVSIEDALILKQIDGQLTSEIVGRKIVVGPENVEVGVKWVVSIPAGETVIARFSVKVTATEGIIENTAIANGQESKDPTNTEEDGNKTKTSIIKSSKSSVITREGNEVEIAKIGDLITYTITVENTGDAEGTTYITDKVPVGTEFVSTPEDKDVVVSESKDAIAWSITLGAKETITKTFVVKVKEINGAIINIADVGGTETDPDTTETAEIISKKEVIDIIRNGESIGKTALVKDGDIIKYKITVTNKGSKKLTNIEVNDKLAGIVLDGQKVNKITIKELEAGTSKEINAEYTVTYDTDIYKNEARLIENEVEVTAKTEGENPEDVKDDDKTETKVEKVSLIDVKKEAVGIKAVGTEEYRPNTSNTTVRPGDIIKYIITVENKGNTVIENIKISEHLDINVGTETGSSEISDIKELRPGEEETIDVYYTVTSADVNVAEQTFINNKVEVSGTTKTDPENPEEKTEEVEDDYTDSTVEVNPDVDIPVLKVWDDNDDKHQIRPQTITFNLLANDVKVATSEPVSGTSYIFENFKKYDENKQPITYTITENAVGGYETKVEINTTTSGYTVTNIDKIRQEKTSIIIRDGVEVTNKVAKVGDIITYTITVYNDSKTDATVTVTDTLPVGVELVDFTTTSSILKWENKVVPANDKLEISFNVKITSVNNGTITNIAKVGNTETDPDEVKVEAYIVFVENGGTEVADMTGISGEKIANTTMPTTTKVGYVFEGWYAEETLTTKVDKLPETYAEGTTTYYAKWIPATDTKYIVNHHLEDLNADTYTIVATDNLTGTTGAQTAAAAKEYTGFTAQEFEQKEIAADGSTVVDIFYTRNSYKITYNIVGEYFAQNGYAEETYEYGATVVPVAEPEKAGYKFSGWSEIPGTMPAEDVIVEGNFTTRNDTKYTVEYYYEIDGNYPSSTELNDVREGTTGAPVAVTEGDTKPTKDGYIFDKDYTGNLLEGTIAADGSTVLKVYFTQQLKVVYTKGSQGTFANQEYTVKYGDTPTAFNGTPIGNAGFNFVGWDKDVTKPVTEDITFTAIWEGLQVTKTRVEIIDKDNLGNTDYVDQEGDIIRYAITVKNIGDIKAENIVLKDSMAVKVISIEIAGIEVEIANRGSNDFAANTDLLKGLTSIIEPNETIVVIVEHTVTDAEVKAALKVNSKIINTATAILNENPYTGKDKTVDPEDGIVEEGTEVKQRCEYRVEYHYNGQLGTGADDVIESAAILGATISFETPAERKGFTYINYVGSTTVTEGTNLIIVNYGKPVTTISKTGSATVDAGANIEYTITVTNTGHLGTTVTVSDELVGTTYVQDSANVGNPTITNNVLTWQVEVGAQSTKTITFKAATPKDSFSDTITNTAYIKDGEEIIDTSNEVTTTVNEVTVKYTEWKEGQQGTDLNIIFLLDNSSSMNEPIEGEENEYSKNNSYYVAPPDVTKTRLYNAKEAIKGFISAQNNNPNTSMSVITFNSDTVGTIDRYVLVENKDINIDSETGRRYTKINNVEYEVSDADDTITATDGNEYCYVTITINDGPILVGTNSTSNAALINNVNNITIGSRREGLGTSIAPAIDKITENSATYLSTTKKNVVIVLADGDFDNPQNDSLIWGRGYVSAKNALLAKDPNLEIYSVGFGNYVESTMKKVSTNNTCYSATDSTTILNKFNQILEEATGSEQTGTTSEGIITFNEATQTIKVSDACPIVATYDTVDAEGNTIKGTLFTCTSPDNLATYGLTITGENTITWDAKVFLANNPTKAVPSTVYIKYYIPRTTSTETDTNN